MMANKRAGTNAPAHDTIVTPGHKVHSTRAQRMSQTDNNNQSSNTAATVANVPLLQSIAPKATIRKPVQDIATPARPSSLSVPVAQATTATAQVMVLSIIRRRIFLRIPLLKQFLSIRHFNNSLHKFCLLPQLMRIEEHQNILTRHLVDISRDTTIVAATCLVKMTIPATAMLMGTPEFIMPIVMPALQWAKEKENPLTQKALEMPFPKNGMLIN
jgi:hypothetical protein